MSTSREYSNWCNSAFQNSLGLLLAYVRASFNPLEEALPPVVPVSTSSAHARVTSSHVHVRLLIGHLGVIRHCQVIYDIVRAKGLLGLHFLFQTGGGKISFVTMSPSSASSPSESILSSFSSLPPSFPLHLRPLCPSLLCIPNTLQRVLYLCHQAESSA